MRALGLGAVAALALASCGGGGGERHSGPLAWEGKPRVMQVAGKARLLQGTLRNDSLRRLDIRAEQLRLRDSQGRSVRSSGGFLSGYVRPFEPQNRGPVPLTRQEEERQGRVVKLDPGDRVPLAMSWRERDGRPARIDYTAGSLPLRP